MMTDPLDSVFKALADSNRRQILDLLMAEAKTTGEITRHFRDIGRCAVMKHIAILHAAGLVNYRRRGRFRINHINPVPIRKIYERWMSPYVEHLAAGMIKLGHLAEGRMSQKESP